MMQTMAFPTIAERRKIHIVNPYAGDGQYLAMVKSTVKQTGEEVRMTTHASETEAICRQLFQAEPYAHAVIYGGDGTVNEAINGIMASGNNHTASFSAVASGSGNDFCSYVNNDAGYPAHELQPLDVIKAGSRYYINSMNMGFDCDVVREADSLKHKRGMRGSAAYIIGVAKVLLKKQGRPIQIQLENVRSFASGRYDDNEHTALHHTGWESGNVSLDGTMLLCACANGPYCGGGFKGAPLCSMTDGYMDVLVIRDVTRLRFLSLVGGYKKGDYISTEGILKPQYADILYYYQCKRLSISSPAHYCLDGETHLPAQRLTLKVVPHAVWYAPSHE